MGQFRRIVRLRRWDLGNVQDDLKDANWKIYGS